MKNLRVLMVVILAVGLYYGGKYLYFKPKYASGESATEFTAELIDGTPFSLSDLRGNYVLLDFWGSWCGPCRKENRGLVKLYRNYRGRNFGNAHGFEIVSIGIETDRRQWESAIARDRLEWPYHVGQFDKFRSVLAQQYGVREIPTKYLIDPDGQILSVNPTLAEIDRILGSKVVATVM